MVPIVSNIIVACCLLLPPPVTGALRVSQKAEQERNSDVIKLETTLVQIPVTVRDKGGRYIIDLRVKDFTLLEDGIQQDIELFRPIEEPFSVVLALDCSGSTKGKLEKIKEAGKMFVRTLRDQDRAMIISFSDSVVVCSELTSDKEKLEGAIEAIESGEYTQVYEAVYTAVWERLESVVGRKAVILFTDGIDTASSEISLEDTIDAVIESEDIIIYPIRYNTRDDVERRLSQGEGKSFGIEHRMELDRVYRGGDEYLYKLAEYSGGIVEHADEISDLPAALNRISDELRRQYLLGYYPKASSARGRRTISVNVNREGARVRVRPAYIR